MNLNFRSFESIPLETCLSCPCPLMKAEPPSCGSARPWPASSRALPHTCCARGTGGADWMDAWCQSLGWWEKSEAGAGTRCPDARCPYQGQAWLSGQWAPCRVGECRAWQLQADLGSSEWLQEEAGLAGQVRCCGPLCPLPLCSQALDTRLGIVHFSNVLLLGYTFFLLARPCLILVLSFVCLASALYCFGCGGLSDYLGFRKAYSDLASGLVLCCVCVCACGFGDWDLIFICQDFWLTKPRACFPVWFLFCLCQVPCGIHDPGQIFIYISQLLQINKRKDQFSRI